ncbi:DUF5686 domain-containing protein [Flavobacterium branchiophilum]|uniref:Putative outer membrane protein n=1 Tax=Flavobacterium branchiophilum (strain FL-15) TaxID=1034807 RepID=G2YZU3_FLABF|nr:DUF5686 and carboxypeptidase regulatory-like domain-containing protein [Flavobacterium branchiophilum]CCB69196.1 Putative outer membrane protein precursor [Flavobacterium branchiophilum FL-15]
MKQRLLLLLLLVAQYQYAQIKGIVTDENGNPIPFVAVYVEDTYIGTATNQKGLFELNYKNVGNINLIFQNLGFKTLKQNVLVDHFPYILNTVLEKEDFMLQEVVIRKNDNLANPIIQNAIANRKENAAKTAHFSADFYSRGLFKIKNLPKKIMGMDVSLEDDIAHHLDSTGSGIIYLSETISKIDFSAPNQLREKILASKISGNDNGFSYNTAKNSDYFFYENYVGHSVKMVSPIADNAFQYYKFKLEGSTYDDNNFQIYKIKVTPKRDKEPVFEGYIYIVDDSFAIYAVDLTMKGYRMKNEFMENMVLKQNYSYHAPKKTWSLNVQNLSFDAGLMGIHFSGVFNYVFTNYDFPQTFDKKMFTNEVLSFAPNANQKDNDYWNSIRPIPLTIEEQHDYKTKDSLKTKRSSQVYLDSIDKKTNKFRFLDIIGGYTYKNSFKKHQFNFSGLLNNTKMAFNTVQGYHLTPSLSYKKWNDETGKNTTVFAAFNYGFAEERLRILGQIDHQFNNQNYARLQLSGGSTTSQFNNERPISPFINSVSSLFFRNNFMKLYDKTFAYLAYSQDVANGIHLKTSLEYAHRKALFNHSDVSYFMKNDRYSSNNPLNPFDFETAGFESHHLTKWAMEATIHFGNTYFSRPDGKFNIRNPKYPKLTFGIEKTLAASNKKYGYTHLNTSVFYELGLQNKGILAQQMKAGKFFDAQNIAFMDYKHFMGNQTHIAQTNQYLNVFHLLPYYSKSTNDAYVEYHAEYNDKGFIMNKLPLLNALKSEFVAGYHVLMLPNQKPYSEFNVGLDRLGFGKFKVFRVDYYTSFQAGRNQHGIIFGCKLLNVLE